MDKITPANELKIQAAKLQAEADRLKTEAKRLEKEEKFQRLREETRIARIAEDAARAQVFKETGTENNPKRDLLWSRAWELGHADNLEAVCSYYSDLADLIK